MKFRSVSQSRVLMVLAAVIGASSVFAGSPESTPEGHAIPFAQLGVEADKKGAQPASSIRSTPGGAKLRALMQDLDAEATPEGLRLNSTSDEDLDRPSRLRLRSVALGREREGMQALPDTTPISPASGPTHWLFHGPPAESKLLATNNMKFFSHMGSLLLIPLLSYAEPVTLKSNDGRAISATVSGFDGKEVTIVKQNGSNTQIPIERLDDASKKIVADEIKKLIAVDERTPLWRPGSEEQKEHTAAPQYSKADISNAYYTSRAFIKKALKAPETAKFSNPLLNQDTTASVVTHEGRIRSTGVVEAQNSFGVPLQQSWQVVVQPEGNQWRVVYAVLGEDTLMDTRKEHKTQNTLTAESFIGTTKQQMINKLGEPSETLDSSNTEDGKFSIYTYSNEKGKETFFTIWDSDGKITSGCYQGTYFSK